MLNAEDTVKVGDKIRPIFIPSVSTSLTVDRAHYYEGVYEVESVYKDYPYPLDGETEGFGTVAFITVNQDLNSTARQAFAGGLDSDRRYYVSHFEIYQTDPDRTDTAANPVIELTEHEKEIERLKEINRVQTERINKIYEDNSHNCRVLTSKFHQLKEKHNWCDEANEVAQEINAELRGGLEIECDQEFEVEVEVTATFRTTITVTVSAATQETASDMVSDNPADFIEQHQIDDALSWNGWDDIEYELY